MKDSGLGRLPSFGDAIKDKVRSRRNTVKDIQATKARLERVANRATEVMVKVTGGVKGATHLKSHMDYISRNGKIELENERGEKLETREQIRDQHKEWAADLGKARKNRRDTINIVLSMPVGTEPDAVRRAVRRFAAQEFGENHQYLMALHHPGNDPGTKSHKGTKQPHVHLTVKALGYDGTKLDPRIDDLQHWREKFAEQMRSLGVEAEATPRRSRGVVRKAKRQVILAIEHRTGKASRTTVAKVQEAAQELSSASPSGNPHREKISVQQAQIRAAWQSDAAELRKSASVADRALAAKITSFVESLPNRLLDERETNKLALVQKINENRKKTLTAEATTEPVKAPLETPKAKDTGEQER